MGPQCGYSTNAVKSWLLVKQDHVDEATLLAKINITTSGRRLLGTALGSQAFITDFLSQKVAEFSERVSRLAKVAHAQPQASYTVFT